MCDNYYYINKWKTLSPRSHCRHRDPELRTSTRRGTTAFRSGTVDFRHQRPWSNLRVTRKENVSREEMYTTSCSHLATITGNVLLSVFPCKEILRSFLPDRSPPTTINSNTPMTIPSRRMLRPWCWHFLHVPRSVEFIDISSWHHLKGERCWQLISTTDRLPMLDY